MKTGLREDALYVQTFGGFSLSYKGKVITGSMKSKESQFIYLMQILLHERAEGSAGTGWRKFYLQREMWEISVMP